MQNKLIDKRKEQLACDIKLSGDTFIRMMSSLENVIYRGCKMTAPGIFNKYDENKSGIIKDLDKLRRQLKLQIKVFLASYEDMVNKNNGEYPFPLNFPKEKINKLIENFKIMAINHNTGDDIYCQAIECIFKGEYDQVSYLLPNNSKNLGIDPNMQLKYFIPINGKVFETTEKAKKEFREKGSINHTVDIEVEKINSIINKDPIVEVYRRFKLLISFPNKKENEDALLQKIKEFYNYHCGQANGYVFPKGFQSEKFMEFLNLNIQNEKSNPCRSIYYYSLLINKILDYKYEEVNSMLDNLQ